MPTETKALSAEVTPKAEGRFTAKISTFDVVDAHGDVVRPGAFRATLERWRATKGRIPVVFNHRTDDPLMHVGEANPHNAMETPTGLLVSGHLYLEEERGQKVFRQLQRGALREWSYGFIVKKSRPLPSGGRELLDLDLVELGPTLKGVGVTETVEVRAQAMHDAATQKSLLTVEQRLAPYRAQLRLAQLRVERWRAARP